MWARPEREPGGAGCTHENPGRGALTGGRRVQKGTSEDTKDYHQPSQFLSCVPFVRKGCKFLLLFMPLWHLLSEF